MGAGAVFNVCMQWYDAPMPGNGPMANGNDGVRRCGAGVIGAREFWRGEVAGDEDDLWKAIGVSRI